MLVRISMHVMRLHTPPRCDSAVGNVRHPTLTVVAASRLHAFLPMER